MVTYSPTRFQSTVLFVALLLSSASAFSLFSKKATAPVTPPRTLEEANEASRSFYRGIPLHQRKLFDGELFTCTSDSSTVIPRARINDNYCDCPDGSDEPGTSACSNGVFTCQNEGFKPLQLTSSRVDDGVCDCCDGTDEDGRQGMCENTCDAEAAASRKALEASLRAYKDGSKVREEYIRDITAQVNEGETAMAALDANVERVVEEVSRLQARLEGEVEAERVEQDAIKRRMLAEYAALLHLEELQVPDLASLIANLFTVFDVIDEDVPELLVALRKDDADAMRPAVEVRTGVTGDMDTYGDYHDDYDNDDFEQPAATAIPEYKEQEPAAASVEVYTAANCALLKHEMDDRLGPFCALQPEDLRRFVVQYLISRKATKEAQLIFGFFSLKKSFADSAEFVTEYNGVNNQPATPCPSELAAVEGACDLDEALRKVMATHNPADYKKKGAEDIRESLRSLSSKQTELQGRRKDHEDLVRASKDYVGFFDLLALRNKCFDKQDGQYTYSVCLGKDVRQRDSGGGGSTLLGNFQNPSSGVQRLHEPQKSLPGLRMKFERGQHCHAFGPRSAEVLLSCGAENRLLESAEPSTCFYSFRMESPVACNDEFARSIGINV
mmetsp:Transcript_18697/g.31152  ORF Transcript_18697/g.31152 Transcript_18697/m.31152 type:complete len:613 (+) Transcript_18697:17-1855(+)